MHWDHVVGLPFFAPILVPGAQLDVYGPRRRPARSTRRSGQFVRPPFFPVTVEELYGQITFHDVADCDLEIDGAKVRVPRAARGDEQRLPRRGRGATVVYLADHQMPHDGSFAVSDAAS